MHGTSLKHRALGRQDLGDANHVAGARRPKLSRLCVYVALAGIPLKWHNRGMARTRISTTVDTGLLKSARRLGVGKTDASMVDEALRALLERHQAAQIDASYTAYDEKPLEEPDAWGDLASFREAASRS